jgi:hypothetical protein
VPNSSRVAPSCQRLEHYCSLNSEVNAYNTVRFFSENKNAFNSSHKYTERVAISGSSTPITPLGAWDKSVYNFFSATVHIGQFVVIRYVLEEYSVYLPSWTNQIRGLCSGMSGSDRTRVQAPSKRSPADAQGKSKRRGSPRDVGREGKKMTAGRPRDRLCRDRYGRSTVRSRGSTRLVIQRIES